ncbi:MAG TPA: poly-gamma-glutamate hydrolase family protein [Lacunisphaera sp.]|nr:poly-gamma-glutamate hydrolase family protein [Lacunisphaera sp.]
MSDTYRDFNHLRTHEHENTDFTIEVRRVPNARVVVVAPHAGGIELKTGPLAAQIAGADFSLYRFTGIKPGGGNKILHITSHRFDEPQCLDLIKDHEIVVTVHGCEGEGEAVYLGGLDACTKSALATALKQASIATVVSGHSFPGEEKLNICNRGATSAGVQFELTQELRTGPNAAQFVQVVREVLTRIARTQG